MVAVAALIISILSFIISLRQHFISTAHNRVSTRPYINMVYETGSDLASGESDFKENPMRVGVLNVTIINNGIGPALVDDLKLYVDGKELKGDADDIWEDARTRLFGIDESAGVIDYFQSKRFNLSKGYCIPAGKSITLVSLRYAMHFAPAMREAINRSRAVLTYQSFYRDRLYTYDTDKVKRGEVEQL